MTIAPPPPLPSPDAEADVWARYFQELENYRAATARLHAQAQADTAANMLEAAQKTTDAQDRFIAAMTAPRPPRAFDPVECAIAVAVGLAAGPMTPDDIAKRGANIAKQMGQEFPA